MIQSISISDVPSFLIAGLSDWAFERAFPHFRQARIKHKFVKFKKSALVKAFEEESFSCCIIGHICADVTDDEAIHDADVQKFLVEWTKKGGVLILQGEGALLHILADCFGTSWIYVIRLFI